MIVTHVEIDLTDSVPYALVFACGMTIPLHHYNSRQQTYDYVNLVQILYSYQVKKQVTCDKCLELLPLHEIKSLT